MKACSDHEELLLEDLTSTLRATAFQFTRTTSAQHATSEEGESLLPNARARPIPPTSHLLFGHHTPTPRVAAVKCATALDSRVEVDDLGKCNPHKGGQVHLALTPSAVQ